MRFITLLLLSAFLLVLSGCEYPAGKQVARDQNASKSNAEAVNQPAEIAGLAKPEARLAETDYRSALKTSNSQAPQANVSLTQADSANAASQAIERKIIRDANLTIEVASPTDSQRKIFSVAESHGGFVVTSEMTQQASDDKS